MFDNVLVGVDGRAGGRDAIALADRLAAPGAEITLAHVHGAGLTPGRYSSALRAAELEESEELLERERHAASVDAHIMPCPERSVGRGLHEAAERRGADLLVIGSCQRGPVGRVLIGDDTSGALNGAPCAVAIAPLRSEAHYQWISNIGIGYDGSPESGQALAAARELAARYDSTIKALSVVSLQSIPYGEPIRENWPEAAKQLMDEGVRLLRGFEGVEGMVTYGEAAEELASFTEGLDLLIVGSRSYGPAGRLFHGSTSNYLARRARCPLLVLPRSATFDTGPLARQGARAPFATHT